MNLTLLRRTIIRIIGRINVIGPLVSIVYDV